MWKIESPAAIAAGVARRGSRFGLSYGGSGVQRGDHAGQEAEADPTGHRDSGNEIGVRQPGRTAGRPLQDDKTHFDSREYVAGKPGQGGTQQAADPPEC